MNENRPRNKSTTVRSHGYSSAAWAARAALARTVFLTRPSAGAQMVANWFLTPKPVQPKNENRSGRQSHLPGGDDLRLSIRVLGHRGPTTLLVHGWNGHASQLEPLAHRIAERGRAVLVDMPGHGTTIGGNANVVGWSRALRTVIESTAPTSVIAHSMGSMAVAHVLGEIDHEVQRVVFIAPAEPPIRIISDVVARLGLPQRAAPMVKSSVEASVGLPMESLLPGALASGFPGDVLVIHDRRDRQVPITVGRDYARSFAGARIIETEGLGHSRILHSPKVIEAATAHATGSELLDNVDLFEPEALRDPHFASFIGRCADAIR